MESSGLRRYCLDRVQREIRAARCTAALFNDPVNVRYATGTTNMTVWLLHNQGRYCIVPAEGKAIPFCSETQIGNRQLHFVASTYVVEAGKLCGAARCEHGLRDRATG
jgi:Xaa-Pro aminopeptidase